MTILTSMFAGVSGINAAGQNIAVIGDNIANVNTPGYKAARAEFQDVLAGSLGSGGNGQIGAGTRLSGTNQAFTQGSLELTNVSTDLAIDGDGFFMVEDTTGRFYTRAGMFRLDENGVLVNEQGQSMVGFGIDPATGLPNGAFQPIDLSSVSSSAQPSATDLVEVSVNLDPNDAVIPAGTPVDHTDPVGTTNFQTGIRVFDSLGNPRNILIYFRNDPASNTWTWYAGTNRSELDMTGYAGFAQGTQPDQFVPVQSGTLTFNSNGLLISEDNTALSLDYDQDGDGTLDGVSVATPQSWSWNNGAASAAISFDFGTPIPAGTGADLTTQFGGANTAGVNNFVRFMNQNGFSQGTLQNISFNEDGFVTGNFSNGQTQRLAQVALARFPSNQGLERVGRNNYRETANSGVAIIGGPNQSGLGSIRSGFLEQSNTDLAEQFVKLIISQRAFQANTRTISTSNDLLAQLVNLGN